MEFLLYILAGGAVGIAIGMTGVGGGSLMTPLLILFGFPYNVAIGTDLLYAAITKSGGIVSHHRQKNIDWKLVGLFAAGSIPASLVTTLLLSTVFVNAEDYKPVLTTALGVMLILTSIVLLFRQKLQTATHETPNAFAIWSQQHSTIITVIAGILLGVFVTLSSVGAGAFCAALLLMLYPKLSSIRVVGTDIAHAVPLTLVAGLGHLIFLGNVNFVLLGCLLIGSLPAIHLGTKLGSRVPSHIMLKVLASILLVLGIRFTFF